MRRWVVVAGVVTLAVALPLAVLAGTGGGRTPLKCMDTVWRSSPVSTSSTSWSTVPGLHRAVTAIFPIAINASALVSGAPVEFRVRSTNIGGQTLTSKPGPTRFVPGHNGPNSFAYQWVERNSAGAAHSISLRLQWRSPSGATVHLLRGDMSLLYTTDGCNGST